LVKGIRKGSVKIQKAVLGAQTAELEEIEKGSEAEMAEAGLERKQRG
jgi:hypothetical protein